MPSLMDFIKRQEGGAIGARLRRLSERIDRDAASVYAEAGIPFEQRWMAPLRILAEDGPRSVSELATELGITHPSVSEARRSLLKAGLVREIPDKNDRRRRTLHVTSKGNALVRRVAPLWQALTAAGHELAEEAHGILAALDRLDAALARDPLPERVRRLTPARLR